jgi:phospholipid/cholesterol/gamma-HCH transport system substrate-binding protein
LENKARYTLVGLFLVIFGVAMISFILWQARYSVENNSLHQYRLYTTSSVGGLKVNSFVEYKGLKIGTIDSININPNNIEEIEIVLSISNPDVIKEDSFATIASQGITGNKYVEIDGGTTKAKTLIPPKDSYETIPLKASFFDSLTSEAGDITKNINTTLQKVESILSQKNIHNIEKLLQNLNNSTSSIEPTMDTLNDTLLQVQSLLSNEVSGTFTQLEELLKNDTKNTLKGVDTLTKEWSELSSDIKIVLNEDVKKLLTQANSTLKEGTGLQRLISNIDNTLDKINNTLDSLNENGGDMLFKTRDVRYGPQENVNE